MEYDEQKENIKLLYTYLTKTIMQKKNIPKPEAQKVANEIIHKNSDNLFGYHGLAYQVGAESVEFFCLYFLQSIFLSKPDNDTRKLASFHFQLWDTLQDLILNDDFDKLVLCLPRGHAKSTVVTYASVIFLHCYGKSFYTIVQGKTERDAQKFIFDVRSAFENNNYIKKAFGDFIDSKRFTVNSNEIQLTNNTKIEAISSTSSMRGRKHLGKRPQYIICDDIAGLDDCLNDQAKQKKLETFQKDVLYAGDTPVYRGNKKTKPGSKYIILGTVLAENDFISSLIKDKTYKYILKRGIPIENFDVDDYFNNNPYWSEFKKIYFDNKNPYAQADAKDYFYTHEKDMTFLRLWTEKYTCMDLALMYYSNPTSFKSEIMNDATHIGEKCFFNIKTETPEEIEQHEFEKTMMTVDCAVSVGKKNDFTAIAVGSKDSTGYRYIRKGLLLKVEFDDYIANVISLLKKYPITHISIEKNTFQGSDIKRLQEIIRNDNELNRRNITFINEYQKKNKENKIRTISGKINNGFIIFNEDDEDFYNQILDYQGEGIGHDDAADCVSELDFKIDEIEIIQPIKFFDRSLLF